MRPIKKGSTDQSVVIRIIDSSDGTPETGVDYDTSGIDLWYRREGATKTSITEAALAALDSAHSDGGIEHIGDGYYRLDLPDAAFAAGADGVMIGGTVTGMIVIGCYVALVDYDPYDSTRLGLSALPNAAADAAGGLPISDAGGLDLDAQISTKITAVHAKLPSKNYLTGTANSDGDVEADGMTGNFGGSVASVVGAVGSVTGAVGSVTAGVGLADDAITSAKFDETTAFPLAAADGDATQIARVGADGDTLETLSDQIDGVSTHSAADVWTATNATLSLAYGVIAERLYRFLMNKMNITDATGAVALRNEGDAGDIATQTITDDDTTTTRTALSWS